MQQKGSPFHSGERVLQLRAGVRDEATTAGEHIVGALSAPTMSALSSRRVVFVAALSEAGYPLCACLVGTPGIVTATASESIELNWEKVADRALERYCLRGAPIALLVLDLSTRERLRISGSIEHAATDRTRIRIAQAFTNGPRYVHLRGDRDNDAPRRVSVPGHVSSTKTFDTHTSGLLCRADTLMVATRHSKLEEGGTQGLDVSHRGGLPGFLALEGASTLAWPEYPGNGFFNTLGNLMLDPRCCVLAVASAERLAVRIRGRAEILWKDPRIRELVGAERGVCLHVEQVEVLPDYAGAIAPLTHYAPELASSDLRKLVPTQWRSLRVVEKTEEAADIVSLHLAPVDREPLLPFLAGQHVRVELPKSVHPDLLQRSYSLSHYSRLPSRYRVTVKRQCSDEMSVSGALHEAAKVGSMMRVSEPLGDFTLPSSLQRPLVFVSVGIGITPMVSMLEELACQHPHHPVWFVHGARCEQDRPLRQELRALRRRLTNAHWLLCLSEPSPAGLAGAEAVTPGRVSVDTLKQLLPFDGYDFYLCGPDDFLGQFHRELREIGVPQAHIHLESFGLEGDTSMDASARSALPVPRAVHFVRSNVKARWEPGSGALLELAEQSGIEAPFSCRTGMCGTCSQKLLAGRIAYGRTITAQPDEHHVLLCSALPASDVEIDL